MVRYTLRQLGYFRAVAEQGGIAPAARALNISQPSIAQALQKLEGALGLTLFERHHARGLTLTLQGRLFLQHAAALAAGAEQVEREARALAAETAGEIRLGVFRTLAPFYAAEADTRLRAAGARRRSPPRRNGADRAGRGAARGRDRPRPDL
ncbi:LysR family transcriptional regulator [Ancylobacter dichloromethanicus]